MIMVNTTAQAASKDLGEPTYTYLFLVGCLNPCVPGTSVRVGSPRQG